MKVYKKKIRKITFNNELYYWDGIQAANDVLVRVYASASKSAYFEVEFTLKETYAINVYRPCIVKRLIEHAILNGWKPSERVSRKKYTYSDQSMQYLNLEKYFYGFGS